MIVSFVNPFYQDTIYFMKNAPMKLNEYLPIFQEKAKDIAKALYTHKSIFILGKGFGEAIARYFL